MKRWGKHIFTAAVIAGLLGGTTAFGQSQATGTATPAAAAKPAAATSSQASGKVNINTADEATLMKLQGIGASKAKAIIAYRQDNGNFKNVEDLAKVKGIGDKTLAQLRDQLTVE